MSETVGGGETTAEDVDRLASPGVLIGIPAYNEAGTIAGVVRDAREHADEVLVVDDGSDDDTRDRAKAAGATLVTHEQNRGYGATLRTIFQYAHVTGADHLVIMDADGQHDPTDIPDLVAAQRRTEAEVVVGSRFADGATEMPTYRRFGLGVINVLTNLALRVGYRYSSVSDTQCGFRAYDREAIATMAAADDIGDGMGASLDILFQTARREYDIAEVPTTVDYEVDDSSTHDPVSHGLNVLVALGSTIARERPARAVSAVALVVLVLVGMTVGFIQSETAWTYVLVVALATVALTLGITLSGRRRTVTSITDR